MIQCSKCKEYKEKPLFPKKGRICKKCEADTMRQWRRDNKVVHTEHKKEWCAANRDHIKSYRQKYYKDNQEALAKRRAERRGERWHYESNKIKNNIQFKLTKRLRIRLHCAVKNNYKSGSAIKDLGCSIEELKVHLESKFQEGMSWDNWGRYGWHIDHIVPLSSFDLTDSEQLKKACHYTNLQPLWAKDNLTKGDKVD